MLNICLIKPPLVIPKSWGIPNVYQPLGLAYIAAVLEKEFKVKILDAQAEGWNNLHILNEKKYYSGLSLNDIENKIIKIKPDIVGITVPFSINELPAVTIATIVKSIDTDIFTILGGPHPTVRPKETLSHSDVDFIVLGEGERTILELIQQVDGEQEWSHVNGIGYIKNGNPVLTKPRELINDLDLIPFPARHLLPMEKYFAASKEQHVSRGIHVAHHKWANMITSRGCPYQCNFCSVHLSMGRIFRPRSPENVVNEIEHLVNDFNIRYLSFEDDNLTLDLNRAKRICDLINKKNFNISWSAPNGIRADRLDEDLIKKMKQSGCTRVAVGVESGVQRVVTNIIQKKLDLKDVERSIVLLRKYGIEVDGYFILGLIGEKKDETLKTIKYAMKLQKLGMSNAGFYIATPCYGTKLYEEAVERGYLKANFDSSLLSTSESLMETPEWKSDELLLLKIYADWILNFNTLTLSQQVKTLKQINIYRLFRSGILLFKNLKFISYAFSAYDSWK